MKNNHIKFNTTKAWPCLGRPKCVYDFAICEGLKELRNMLRAINERSWVLISVTQLDALYTVFFRRRADE